MATGSASRFAQKVALVTGASAGIGAKLVSRFAQQGMHVVGCARNADRIQRIADDVKTTGVPGSVTAVKCDMRNEDEILAMFADIKKNFGGLDVCVCNAGLAWPAPMLSAATELWREMLDVNVMAYCICAREAYKSMTEKNVDEGHIFLMNSIAGHNTPNSENYNFYSITKHAVTALTAALRSELKQAGAKIRVTSVSPGRTATEFMYRATQNPEMGEKAYNEFKCLEDSDVVDAVCYALNTPSHVQVHELILHSKEQT